MDSKIPFGYLSVEIACIGVWEAMLFLDFGANGCIMGMGWEQPWLKGALGKRANCRSHSGEGVRCC